MPAEESAERGAVDEDAEDEKAGEHGRARGKRECYITCMAVDTLILKGKKYALVPWDDYQKQRGAKKKPTSTTRSRLTRQDRADIAEAKRQLALKAVDYRSVRSELGLER
jgi:hypothetical protein